MTQARARRVSLTVVKNFAIVKKKSQIFKKRRAKSFKTRRSRKILKRMTKIKLLLNKLKSVDDESLIINHSINHCNISFLTINLIIALRKIRKYQKNVELLISKALFRHLLKKIVRDMINENDDLRMQVLAINILHEIEKLYIYI